MTRILRFLMIVAVAWPFFGNTAAAQEVVSVNETCTTVKKSPSDNFTGNTQILNAEPNVNHANATTIDNGKTIKVAKGVKVQTKPRVVKVTKSRANVPEGYSLITLIVLDTGESGTGVWNDGTGYQMLLDVDHDTYGSTIPATGALTTSGDVPASTYALFEYKIPENADGALSTTNILVSGSQSITIPAGTYDWCITNPTPTGNNARMWIASEQGDVQGRYDDYVFESGFVYTFTISLVGENDNVEIGITSDYDNPTNLAVSNITTHEATLTWSAGGDETSWNVQYKKKADFEWTSVGTLTSANYLIEGLDGLTLYQARVQSVYSGGLSGWELITFKTANNAAEFCELKDMGEISYSLTDSYGDGWNGAAINIVDAESGTIIESITLSSGESAEGTVNICYGRTVNFVWVKGDYNDECSFTLTDPDGEVIYEASTTNCYSFADGYVFKSSYMMTMPNPTESLDFGVVDVNTPKTLSAYIKNDSNNDVNATLTATAPFSVASTSVTMHPGISRIPVTFTPVDAVNYNGTLTIDINGENTTITLTGVGNVSGSPAALRDSTFFAGITYEWTDSTGVAHTSNLSEIATDPDQMIAMMKEIYTNKSIPGTYKRGYTATGGSEGYDDVYYSGVGEITRGSGYDNASYYSYSDAYGWDIPGNIKYNSYSTGSRTYYYAHLDTVQYKPNQEGMTLLLVEVVDDYKKSDVTYTSGNNTYWETFDDDNYLNLRQYVVRTIKSVRVITEAKRTGKKSDFTSGSLFKIDCDKMNKFFLLGKGQARWVGNSYWADYTSGSSTYNIVQDFCAPPCYIYSSNRIDKYVDKFGTRYFYHMFEQFSPVASDASIAKADIYQDLVNMDSFGVEHDCMSIIPSQGHQFMMYGDDSDAADCQDVRDLMFFVPDYRMMKDDGRDPTGARQKFLNYNTTHQPTMGLFVIKQNPITGEQIDGQDTYKLHLTWTSNLLDFLPGEEGMYTLYRVITNDDGTKTYEAVGEFDPNTYECYDNVPMMQTGQQVTYVVRGQDVGKFLSLQMSNEESFIIPGLDPSELVLLKDATHYSRFDAQRVRNCYSNKLTMENNVDGIKQANLTSSTQLTITRTPQGSTEPIIIATVTFNPSSKKYTVQMSNQAENAAEFPECADGSRAGYHANNGNVTGNGSWTGNYTVNANGDINLGTLEIFDNFVEEIPDDNTHPNGYLYNVTSNYECPATSVYLNAANCTSGDEIWYAWTWNNQTDGKWVMGTMQGNLLKFAPAKNNIIFVRMNPNSSSVVPSWGAAWNQTGDLSTQGYIGHTFTVNWGDNGSMYGSWSNTSTPDMARSNAFRIPIYKTSSQINGVFSQSDVDGDTNGQLGVPKNVEFGVGVQLSSKSEILRYDTYRWNEGAPRYSVASADGDDEQDLPPAGLAMNQGDYYTISMNPDTDNETNGETSVSSGTGTATFVDEVPNESVNAAAYVYAPIIEVMSGRGDYNTYGGPLQTAAVGKLNAERDTRPELMSKYSWTDNGMKYAYYNINLQVNTKQVPTGYKIYKIRAWRTVDPDILGEEYDENPAIAARLGDENGKFMFEEINFGTEAMDDFINNSYSLGSGDDSADVTGANGTQSTIDFTLGTFGAQKLRTDEDANDKSVIDQLDATFVVRLYYTRSANLPSTSGAPMLKDVDSDADGKYYIVEQVIPFQQMGGDVPTAIQMLDAREVVGTKYYNVAGVESDKPFQGVNIVVTRYSDGSTTTTKILK